MRLAAQGASLAISDLNKAGGLDVVRSLSAAHPKQSFSFAEVNCTDYSAVVDHVKKASEASEHGIAGLVCAAGIAVRCFLLLRRAVSKSRCQIPGPRMHEMSIESYLQLVNVNQHGTIYYNHAVLDRMVKQNTKKMDVPAGGYAIVYVAVDN